MEYSADYQALSNRRLRQASTLWIKLCVVPLTSTLADETRMNLVEPC